MSLQLKENINTASYWGKVFAGEILNKNGAEILTFGKIRTYLGLRVIPNDKIIDIGCGYGVLLNKLKPLAAA